MADSESTSEVLLTEFRLQYRRLENTIREAFVNGADTIVLERLTERLEEYIRLVHIVS